MNKQGGSTCVRVSCVVHTFSAAWGCQVVFNVISSLDAIMEDKASADESEKILNMHVVLECEGEWRTELSCYDCPTQGMWGMSYKRCPILLNKESAREREA